MIPYMAQSRQPLNSQVLAIIFPFATIPATPHYPVFTDRYSPQYGMLAFLLHFMANTFFFNVSLRFPSRLCFHLVSESYSRSNPVHATIPESSHKCSTKRQKDKKDKGSLRFLLRENTNEVVSN